MKVKKIKKKCEVRGCKNTDTFALTNTNEFGNSIIICEECLKRAVKAVSEYDSSVTVQKAYMPPPPVFFNVIPEAEVKGDTVEEATEETVADVKQTEDDGKDKEAESISYTCPDCGKEYKTEQGLSKHKCTSEDKQI